MGDTLGLAPGAHLYAISSADLGSLEPLKMAQLFEKVLSQKKKDPGITVVGISLGFEIPDKFRPCLARSKVYQKIAASLDELHGMGVLVVASSGNSGNKNDINLLALLPHVIPVGALSTHLTLDTKDDTQSSYSTGNEASGSARFWAHADPVLYLTGAKRPQWLEKGGTSFAQPYVSATILLIKEVNPALSMDQIVHILEVTCNKSPANASVKMMDPMKAVCLAASLPGSTYTGERHTALIHALGITDIEEIVKEYTHG